MSKLYENLIYKESIDSTNLEARRILESCRTGENNDSGSDDSLAADTASFSAKKPFIVVAREQTAGRGRQGKSFFSPGGSGIYMTIALPTGDIPSGAVTLTCRVGIAVSKAIDAEFRCRTGIKWVNDIFLSGRKICGILCEAIRGEDGTPSHILIGIGINISTEEFPDDIKDSAGSVLSAVGVFRRSSGKGTPLPDENVHPEGNTQHMTKEFVQAFSMRIYDSVIKHIEPSYDPIADYKDRSVVLGHDVTFFENGVAHSAHAVDIDASGGLVVRLTDSDEIKTLSSGEISLRVCECV